jgi:hypothetical protein
VVATFRLYYDATIAVGLMAFIVIACGFVVATERNVR